MKTIKQKIFNALDKDGYLSDTQIAKIYGKEPNWSTVEEYKRQWHRLQSDRNFFEGKTLYDIHKMGRKHLVKTEKNTNRYYTIGKDYFNETQDHR